MERAELYNMDTILEVKNLYANYYESKGLFKKSKPISVLSDISFTMKSKDILGLIGESGCGKSTLARILVGIEEYDSGIINNYGIKPQMVFQDPYSFLNPSKRIGWILAEAIRMAGCRDKNAIEQRVVELLYEVGLAKDYIYRLPRQLSGGQRQRVGIAAALAATPRLLIADEPVSALDVSISSEIIELFRRLHDNNDLSLLFIAHDPRIVYNICDRVMVMRDGVIIEQGDKEDIYKNPACEYTKKLLLNI